MLQKSIIILFAIITAVFSGVIFKIYSIDSKAEYKKSIASTITEINDVRGRPLQRTAKLNDGTLIDVPEDFVPYIQTGDSILKNTNSYLYTLKSTQRNIIITTKK